MATARIEITVLVSPRARRIIDLLGSPAGLLKAVGARFMSYVQESFQRSGQHQGFSTPRWAPLAWGTVALRKRGGSAPLQDTGMLKQSYVTETDGKTYVAVGTNRTPLAFWHEFGTGTHGTGKGMYIIRPIRAKVLAAELGSGAHGAAEHSPVSFIASKRPSNWMFFGKEVHHPGVAARPVLPTKEIGERLAQGLIDEFLETYSGRS